MDGLFRRGERFEQRQMERWRSRRVRLLAALLVAFFLASAPLVSPGPFVARADETGIQKLKPEVAAEIDSRVASYGRCSGTSVGLVVGGKIVFTRSYG